MDFSGFSILVAFFLLFYGDNQVKSLRKYITWDDIKIKQDHHHQKITERFSFDNGNGNESRVIVVDQNGKGDSLTVQAAVDMVPFNNSNRVKIYILPGIYRFACIISSASSFIILDCL